MLGFQSTCFNGGTVATTTIIYIDAIVIIIFSIVMIVIWWLREKGLTPNITCAVQEWNIQPSIMVGFNIEQHPHHCGATVVMMIVTSKFFLSNHHSFQMLEKDLLPMTRPMMAVVTSEQRILSWIIGIRYIEVLILSELDNRRDRWGWWAQCEYQRRIRGLMAGPQTMAKDLSDPAPT